MKFVIQRVSQASVEIDEVTHAQIGAGILVFMGIHRDDTEAHCIKWVDKILKLRIFPDKNKPINRSIQDVNGEVLIVSQFTLYGDTQRQNRPSFIQAAVPELAKGIYENFISLFKERWPQTQTGEFAAEMKVKLINDGPVTLILE